MLTFIFDYVFTVALLVNKINNFSVYITAEVSTFLLRVSVFGAINPVMNILFVKQSLPYVSSCDVCETRQQIIRLYELLSVLRVCLNNTVLITLALCCVRTDFNTHAAFRPIV
jgi:hypothetical protein